MRYSPFERLVAPARERAEIWRLLAGLAVCVVLYSLLLAFYRSVVSAVFSVPAWSVDLGLYNPTGPVWTLILLFSFAALIVAVLAVVRILHDRPPASLFGGRAATVAGFVRTAGAILVLYVALEVLPPHDPYGVIPNEQMSTGLWLVLLPLSLAGLLTQTTAEELVFRGYLQSQIAARFPSPLAWMLVPSALFAALHYDTAALGHSAALVALWAFVFGVLASDLTARAGTLGPAIGFHFANNAYALLYIGFPDNLGGLALYHLPFRADEVEPASAMMLLDFGFMAVSWLAARVAIRR